MLVRHDSHVAGIESNRRSATSNRPPCDTEPPRRISRRALGFTSASISRRISRRVRPSRDRLQPNRLSGERLETDQVVKYDPRRRVVRAVVKRRRAHPRAVGERLVPLGEFLGPSRLERADGLRQVAVDSRVGEVEVVRGEISYHPRHDGVLCEVVVRSAGERIEPHQIVEVGDAPRLPVVEQLLTRGTRRGHTRRGMHRACAAARGGESAPQR